MAVYHGNNVDLDYGNLELTEELEQALSDLDDSCRYGSGGTYDINETDEFHAIWEAVPCDGPFETLYFLDGKWIECYDLPEEEEEVA